MKFLVAPDMHIDDPRTIEQTDEIIRKCKNKPIIFVGDLSPSEIQDGEGKPKPQRK